MNRRNGRSRAPIRTGHARLFFLFGLFAFVAGSSADTRLSFVQVAAKADSFVLILDGRHHVSRVKFAPIATDYLRSRKQSLYLEMREGDVEDAGFDWLNGVLVHAAALVDIKRPGDAGCGVATYRTQPCLPTPPSPNMRYVWLGLRFGDRPMSVEQALKVQSSAIADNYGPYYEILFVSRGMVRARALAEPLDEQGGISIVVDAEDRAPETLLGILSGLRALDASVRDDAGIYIDVSKPEDTAQLFAAIRVLWPKLDLDQ